MDIKASSGDAAPAAVFGRHEGWGYAEQWLYDVSPVGALATTLALYLVLIGAYAIAAAIDHHAWIVAGKAAPQIDRRAWIGLCLSLIVCAVLGLQRYSMLAEVKDAPAFARAVRPDMELMPTLSHARLRRLTFIGAAPAAAGMLWFQTAGGEGVVEPALIVWFCVIAGVLGALFARGVELTGSATRRNREIFRRGLAIDLLRIERLYPFGRAAARTALIWFTVSAASLLLFVGADMAPAMVALSVVCGAIGATVFLGTLGRIRAAIRAAKAAELETIRHEIGELRAQVHADPAAAPKLQSLLAYEARIAAVHEWPFDQSTLARVAASSLVLAVPWFGQAFAGAVVERFSGLIH
jgi:hypothetical protein